MSIDLTTSDPDGRLEAISAFVDGEHVNPDALRSALALEEGRDYLIDLLKIREAISAAEPARVNDLVRGQPRRPPFRPLAAAVVFAAVAGGYVAGQRTGELRSHATTMGDIIVTSSASDAPEPTRVIKLEPGLNWTDRTGGH